MLRRLLAAALLTAVVAPPVASAQAPGGDWTSVRKDAFKHYACRTKEKDGEYTVRTATFDNGDQKAIDAGIGAYTAIARSSNKNLVAERTSTSWSDHYVRTNLRNARLTDRLWMQGAYYGPADPWSDGFAVKKLVRCDPR
jgi:hypothetical protein